MAYEKQIWNNGDIITEEKLNHIENGIANIDNSIELITHAELLAKRDLGTLIPGKQYRITDYECTVTYDNTRVEPHPFDIIVTAIDNHSLNTKAKACLHDGDNYYSNYNVDLSLWELEYCIDNDGWVDENNGKGYIYYMKDDFNNEFGYDFKQIQFKRYPIASSSLVPSLLNHPSFAVKSDNNIGVIVDPEYPMWFYTFSSMTETTDEQNQDILIIEDNSVKGNALENKGEGLSPYGFGNVFLNTCAANIFKIGGSYGNTFEGICYDNIFEMDCRNNIFGNNYNYNIFGKECCNNIFGTDCTNNTFEAECSYNVFGVECSYNVLGFYSCYNVFRNECNNNVLSTSSNNTFQNGCNFNILKTECNNNTFGNECCYNTFEIYCSEISLNNNAQYNIFGHKCRNIQLPIKTNNNIVGNNCEYLVLLRENINDTTSPLIYYYILSGTKGTSNNTLEITCPLDREIVTYVGKNSNNELKMWIPADQIT